MVSSTDPLARGDHTFTTANNDTLSYHITTSTKPGAPLWVHSAVGWGIGRRLYVRSLAPLISKHFTVLDFSPRGADESSRPKDSSGADDPSQMSSTSMAQDLESLRTYLSLPSIPVLSGHSNGGAIALAYAELYPTHVNHVILIGSQLLGYDNSATFKHFAALRALQEPYKKAYETWAGPFPTTDEGFQEFLTGILPSYFVDPVRDVETVGQALDGAPLYIWCFQAQDAADRADNERMIPMLKDVRARVLMVYGREDIVCGWESGEVQEKALVEAGVEAKLVVHEPCGHFPWIEKRDEFLKAVGGWLGVEFDG